MLDGAVARVPADATAFAHRNGDVLVAFLAMYGGGPEVVARYEAWASNAVAAVEASPTGAYVNFLAEEGTAGVSAAYPKATFDRLRRIKAKYDPENLFRRNQNVPPAA